MPPSRTYSHKGIELIPLTPEIARSLDKGDLVKYIGPDRGGYNSVYRWYKRRVFSLTKRPEVFSKKIIVEYYGNKAGCPIEDLALVERGYPYSADMRRAERLVPVNLKSFKRNLSELIRRTQENIDRYLEDLPLHKKLELFKGLTPEETLIYDCLYKDIEVLIGLKEEAPSELPTTS